MVILSLKQEIADASEILDNIEDGDFKFIQYNYQTVDAQCVVNQI
jgi:hypothetical protein